MAAPAVTPVVPVVSGTGSASASASAAKALLSKTMENVKASLSQKRAWSEMVDRNSFAKPDSVAEATSRLRKNLSYFKVNYAICLFAVVALSLLWNPYSLFWLAVLGAAWGYLFMVRAEPVVIAGRTLSEREKVLGMSGISLLVIFAFTSVGSVLISGIMIGSLIIAGHAALRVPDDLFLDDQEASAGFLSFLGTGAPQLGHV